MRLDLHLHTTCSDGLRSPEDAAALAARAGLGLIAVTDHDTTAGVARARARSPELDLTVIAGIEISATFAGADLHLLGLGVTPEHPAMTGVMGRLQARRRARVGEIVARLRKLGIAIAVDDVRPPEGNAAVGRPHVAQALVRLGVVRQPQEAFDRFIGAGAPAYVAGGGPEVTEAIALVHEAGGVSVWAHPSAEDAKHFAALGEAGLDGAETLRPNLTGAAANALDRAARAAGLLVSGGSDWHGGNPALGNWYVTERRVGPLLERLGATAHDRRPVA